MLYRFPSSAKGYKTRLQNDLLGITPVGADSLLSLLHEMSRRESSGPIDKICGLGYLLGLQHIPTFSGSQEPESAWNQMIHNLSFLLKLELLSRFPYPGPNSSWAPTWSQVDTFTLASQRIASETEGYSRISTGPLEHNESGTRFSINTFGYHPDLRLSQGTHRGIYNVKLIKIGTCQITLVDKDMCIPDGIYHMVLISLPIGDFARYFALGQRLVGNAILCTTSAAACEEHMALRKIAAIEVVADWKYLLSFLYQGIYSKNSGPQRGMTKCCLD